MAPDAANNGGEMARAELTTESVELSDGMLGIIGAYGMRAALDVRDLYRKTACESASTEHRLASADIHASAGAAPKAYR